MEIEFGLIAPKIKDQLKRQRIEFNVNKIGQIQKSADAITRLYYDELIDKKLITRLREKLLSKIKEATRSPGTKPTSRRNASRLQKVSS
ncbi:hypothetical protein [Siphonobacter sp. SORGH_AS_0500]|uniref:hypothetical protein n=1 Tax=Siphonobacter sp. SORGH_AS_0500 TaxID=1864824 RepID=UPI00285F1DD7|nr:hypothetical protein [Siphonobacter sp. SORGH_AS_0500]MDR6195193.1 hypothetical protein [Siphonobacter sp. SORGH_AS_0500]